MPVAVLDQPSRPVAGRGTIGVLLAAGLVASFFFAVVALPYFLSTAHNVEAFGGARRAWLLLHIGGGGVALFAGPVQLWLGLANRRMELHRRLGIVYIAAVVVSSASAYYLSTHHPSFGFVFGAGLFGLATAWLLTTGMAFVAIRRHLLEQHKEWMIRSYVVTFAFVTFRVAFALMMAGGMTNMNEVGGFCAWACWSIPLLGTEAWLHGRKILSVAE